MSNPDPAIIDGSGQSMQNFYNLFCNSRHSDVTLIVDNKQFKVHRIILASYSELLESLLYESNAAEVSINAPAEAFGMLLDYFYGGTLKLGNVAFSVVLDIYGLVTLYRLAALRKPLETFITHRLDAETFPEVLKFSRAHNQLQLRAICFRSIDQQPFRVLALDKVGALSFQLLRELLHRENLRLTTIDKFKAVAEWINTNNCSGEDKYALLSTVNWNYLSTNQIAHYIRASRLYDDKYILDFIAARNGRDVKEEPKIWYEDCGPNRLLRFVAPEPYSSEEAIAEVITGQDSHALFSPTGYCRGAYMNGRFCIMVRLKQCYSINSMTFGLGKETYEFKIIVSPNSRHWERVYKHDRSRDTRQIQIFFPARQVQFIKFEGTVEVCGFRTTYNNDVEFKDTFLVPQHGFNVIRETLASFVPGRFNSLLSASSKFEALPVGQTLEIHLMQPMWLEYCGFKLCHEDQRSYNVEVFAFDEKRVQKQIYSNKKVTTMQQFPFAPQVVTKFTIICHSCSRENELRLIFFEAGR